MSLFFVPQGAELIVDAQVLNKNTGFVREGQNAEIKLEAFPFTRGAFPAKVGTGFASGNAPTNIGPHSDGKPVPTFPKCGPGVLHATLEHISRDAIQDEKLGLVFPCRLKLKGGIKALRTEGKVIALQPGMSVTAEIKTGNRRVIDFLLSPLARRVEEAGRER